MKEYKDAIKKLNMPKEVVVYNGSSDPCDVLIGWFCACGGGHPDASTAVLQLKRAGYDVSAEHLITLALYREYLSAMFR